MFIPIKRVLVVTDFSRLLIRRTGKDPAAGVVASRGPFATFGRRAPVGKLRGRGETRKRSAKPISPLS